MISAAVACLFFLLGKSNANFQDTEPIDLNEDGVYIYKENPALKKYIAFTPRLGKRIPVDSGERDYQEYYELPSKSQGGFEIRPRAYDHFDGNIRWSRKVK